MNMVGGTTPYSYEWSNGQTTQTISGLSAGTYSVTVTDNEGEMDEFEITITEPDMMISIANTTNVACFEESNGAAEITTTIGGTPDYTYEWSNGQVGTIATDLTAGTYNVTVTDGNECNSIQTVVINEPDELLVTDEVMDILNGDDGAIDITVVGGTEPYSYEWSDGSTQEDLVNVSSGTYSYTVTDANGCTFVSDPISVMSTSTIDVELEQYIQVFPNPSNGKFTVDVELIQSSEVDIRIYDVIGRTIGKTYNAEIQQTTLLYDLSNQAEGVYIMKILVDEKLLTKRLVVTRQ